MKTEILKYILIGCLVVALCVSSFFCIYYYNSSKALTGRTQGAALETAQGLRFSLSYAAAILEAEAEPENINTLTRYFDHNIHSAIQFLRALRMYLLPSYEDSLQGIEDLFFNISTQVYGTFNSITNESLAIEAFEELNLVASEQIKEIGIELAEAFESLRRNSIVQTFKVDPSRIENAVSAASNLKTILNQWITKYLQM